MLTGHPILHPSLGGMLIREARSELGADDKQKKSFHYARNHFSARDSRQR
jgi:hypothetical protein